MSCERSINVRLGKGECVLNQFQPRRYSFRDDHFDDVETKEDVGIVQQTQPGQAPAGNSFSLVAIDRLEGPAEILPRPRFYFDENERVAIAADDIDFTAGASAEITIQDLVTVPLQELAGQFLPPSSKSQMPGTRT